MPDIYIRSLSHLIDLADAAVLDTGGHLWWRGHADASWDLTPKVFRDDRGFRYEKNVVNHFVHRAPARQTDLPAAGDRAGWLQLMQHYGAPTRLLDWSESPLVAAFFSAAQGAHADVPGAVWSLDPFRMNHEMHGEPSLFNVVSPEVRQLINPAFSDKDPEVDSVAAFFPHHVDMRLLVQLACFTIHGAPGALNAHHGAASFLRKFVIPVEVKQELFNQLFRVGVRRSHLFPDLTGLAAEIDALRFQQRRAPLPSQDSPADAV